jgi:hypothetical protein
MLPKSSSARMSAGISLYLLTRRKRSSALSKPAVHRRCRMCPSRHRFTRRVTVRHVSKADSMGLVLASVLRRCARETWDVSCGGDTFLGAPFTISAALKKQLAPAVTFDGENFLVACVVGPLHSRHRSRRVLPTNAIRRGQLLEHVGDVYVIVNWIFWVGHEILRSWPHDQ